MAKIKYSKAVSGNTDTLTSQAFIYSRPAFPTKEKGEAVLAILISAIGEDIFTRVRQIGLDLEEKFFEAGEGSLSERLKNCFEFIDENLTPTEEKNILLVLWQENVLHLLSFGKNLALLSRQGKIVDIAEGAGDQVISGFIKPEDKLLMINPKLFLKTAQAEEGLEDLVKEYNLLIESLTGAELENLAEEVEKYQEAKQKLEPIAAIKIENRFEEVLEEAEEEEFPHIASGENSYIARNTLIINIQKAALKLLKIAPGILKPAWQDKRVRTVFIILLLLGLGGLFLMVNLNRQGSEENQRFASFLQSSKQKYQEAQNLKDSNPEQAQKSLSEAKTQLTEALKIKPNNGEAKSFSTEIEQNSKQILKVFEVSEFPLFLSLDLIKKDFSANALSFSLGKILLLDTKQISLVSLDLETKNNEVLAGSQQLGKAQFASLNGDNAFIFSEDKGIVRVDIQSKKATSIVSFDDEYGKIADIFAFSGNVYLLDIIKNQIWKYIPAATSYSEKNTYLKEGVKADFAGGRRLKIDYSVWVQKADEILKFTGGSPDFFSVGGIDKPIESISAIFVPEEEDKLYILDSSNSRLVVLKKNGVYDHQYIGEKFKTASDLVVDEERKKAYLLEGNKLYSLDLK